MFSLRAARRVALLFLITKNAGETSPPDESTQYWRGVQTNVGERMGAKGVHEWTRGESAILRRISNPDKAQSFIDALPYRCEDGHLSAKAALRDGRAHCFDGALLAAAALSQGGFSPRLIDLCATRDDDHIICAFQYGGRWGAVAKSNFPGLRFREPVYVTPRELVLSYFEFYFNLEGEKSLREYSEPLRLPSRSRLDWECDDSCGDLVVELLSAQRHYRILRPRQEKRLRPMDNRLYRSQLLGVRMKGAYGGR